MNNNKLTDEERYFYEKYDVSGHHDANHKTLPAWWGIILIFLFWAAVVALVVEGLS